MRNWLYKSSMYCLLFISLQVQSKEFLINRGYKGPGLGAFFCSVLGLLHRYDIGEIAGFSVKFNENSYYYDPTKGSNWWEYYFEPLALGDYTVPQKIMSPSDTNKCIGLALCILPISRGNQLITKYIRVKPHITEKVDAFFNQHLKDTIVIGVHYRGTDKQREVKKVDYAKVRAAIKSVIKKDKLKHYTLFVASDEQAFIDYIKTKFKHVVCTNARRSIDGQPLHYAIIGAQFKERDNAYSIGEECVIDMLLLARSHILIRTASCVSACALFFNPKIKVVSLSTHPWASCLRNNATVFLKLGCFCSIFARNIII